MTDIKSNIAAVIRKIDAAAAAGGRAPEEVCLIAVTKTRTPEEINEAIRCGITDIGENKAQEIIEKYSSVLPVRWHMIGHLQTNKVKYIIDKVCMIHSVDSLHLMEEIDRQAEKHGITADILLQINITGEESKFGISPDEVWELLDRAETLRHIKVCGLMTIMPKNNSVVSNRLHFDNMRKLFLDISSKKYNNSNMRFLSMGMTDDFETAVEAGSSMVRVGRAIFGERNYVGI